MKKMLPLILVAVGLVLVLSGSVLAWSMYTKSIDSQGRLTYTGEVTITSIEVIDILTQVDVIVDSTVDTQIGVTYTVHLILGGVDVAQLTASWTNQQIGGGYPMTLSFMGQDLTAVALIAVEVIY